MNAQITELEALDAPSEWGDFAAGVGVGMAGAAVAVGVGVALT